LKFEKLMLKIKWKIKKISTILVSVNKDRC
jgi:hypothetical protein